MKNKAKTVTFIAKKYKQLRVVLDPRISESVGGIRVMKGMTGQFPQGKTVEFNEGEYSTSDEAIIEALKAHPSYGMSFYSDEPGEAITPTDEAVALENEKKEVAEELASQCPKCGEQFKNAAALTGHMRVHNEKE